MKRTLAILLHLAALQANAGAQGDTGIVVQIAQDAPGSNVAADRILDDVLSRMPRNPLFIAGQLQSKDASGTTERTLNVEAFLQLGGNPPSARYTMMDEYKRPLEQLKIIHKANEPAAHEYLKGSPLQAAGKPDMFGAIQGTDVCWSDLTLSFLWWRHSAVVGSEAVRGRNCLVLKVSPPAEEGGRKRTVRLWIDEQHRILLQAAECDDQDRPLRRLSVKSFKKIDEEWMIKDIEIESLPSGHRTLLRVRELQNLGK